MADMQQDLALASRLRACGHFLYYQTGGKAGQRRILAKILEREGLTQKELQDELEISSGALSEILGKMEQAQLIGRKKSRDDKRQVTLTLTGMGREMALRVKAHHTSTLQQMFECLDGEERAQLDTLLEKLVAHLDTLKIDPPLVEGAGAKEE